MTRCHTNKGRVHGNAILIAATGSDPYGIEMVVAYYISSHEVKVKTAAEIRRCDLMSTTKQYEISSNQCNHVLPNS